MTRQIISLFTGAGGLDWGFHNSGNYDLIVSNELLEAHLKTYTQNNKLSFIKLKDYTDEKEVGICGDIHELDIPYETDVILGGPPCQDFSVLRGSEKRAGLKVKRGKLYEQYLRILKKAHPKVFVFENVVGMTSANRGLAYELIQQDFIDAGYKLVFNDIINFSNLGVPQARKRLIIIGVKKSLIKNQDVAINHILSKYLSNELLEKYPLTPLEIFEGEPLSELNDTYLDIIKKYKGCMDDIDNDEANRWKSEYKSLKLNIVDDYLSNNNISFNNSEEINKAMLEHEKILKILGYYNKKISEQQYLDNSNKFPRKNRKVTERLYHIPPFYNFKAVENTPWKVKGLMSNIYRRLHPLKPSPTIIAYGGGGTGGYHYEYDRQALTNRERARIQTFPDNYLFNGNTAEVRAQIGEAVPPLASYWIEKVVTEILKLIDDNL